MKKLFLLICVSFFITDLIAQTSPLDPVCTFNYQAVARDADDNVMADKAMTVRFTILDGPGANELYIEEHETTTSSLGLFNLEVGNGDVVGGSMIFDAIPWVIRKHYLKVELDLDGSDNFIVAGEAPILAVPIAIQAKTASISISTLDTIKRIDTIRVDTMNVKKIFAKAICVDSIIGKVVIDSIITEHICINGDLDIKGGELIMRDKNGEIIFGVDSLGNSYHAGFETFAGGMEILGLEGEPIFTVDPLLEFFFGVGTLTEGDVVIANGNFEMYDSDGNVVFSVDTFGNSYHAGFETFAGGMEVLDVLGNPIMYIDPLEDLLFGRSTVTNGNVVIENGSLEMVNANNDVVFSVDQEGNSYHKGEEVFEGGIVLTNPENNETVIYMDAGADGLTGYAFTMNGNMMVNGFLQAQSKNFVIDHPLNPEEMNLRHYSIESDQMGTVYNGTVSFDKKGEAWVQLPEWFEALNTDFSYQLTCIGGYSNVYIAQEVKENKFKIAGGKKGMKVSWQVSGVRHDPVSNKNKLPVEEYKSDIKK